MERYGADALRLYLIDSPVVRGESLRFKEEGVRDVLKDVFLPWYNAYRFLVQNVHGFEKVGRGGRRGKTASWHWLECGWMVSASEVIGTTCCDKRHYLPYQRRKSQSLDYRDDLGFDRSI